MNAVWNAMVNEVQGVYAKPVDIQLPATQYDMGRAVGTFVEEAEDGTVEIAVTAAVSTERKGTKAEVVRDMIRAAKQQGGEVAAVIAQAVAALGFTKALATAYVRNNWDKVAV